MRRGAVGAFAAIATLSVAGTALSGTATDPPSYLAIDQSSATTTLELCSAADGHVQRVIGRFPAVAGRRGPSLTANGAALAPDGRSAYLTTVGLRQIQVERIDTATGRRTRIGAGAQPAVSPDSGALAYATGRGFRALAVRDLITGRTRTIDLKPLIGHGSLLTGAIAWLAGGTDVAVLPDESIVWDLVGKPPKFRPDRCTATSGVTDCVIVVHVGAAGAAGVALTQRRVAVPGGYPDVSGTGAVSGDSTHPEAIVTAAGGGRPMVVNRLALSGAVATVQHLASLPGARPAAFAPSGDALLYGERSGLGALAVPGGGSYHSSRRLGKGCPGAIGW